jgi:hypothetical protein
LTTQAPPLGQSRGPLGGVTITRVSYRNNAIIKKIIVQKYTIKPFAVTFDIFKQILKFYAYFLVKTQ